MDDDSGNKNTSEKLDYLIRMVGVVLRLLSEIKSENRDQINIYKAEVMSVKAETSELHKKMTDLKKNYKTLQDHIIKLEFPSRSDNLLMDGITENANETDAQCRDKVYDILVSKFGYAQARNSIKIVRCHHLSKRPVAEKS